MLGRDRLLVYTGLGIVTMMITLSSWLFIVTLVRNHVVVLPRVGAFDFNNITLMVQPLPPENRTVYPLYLFGVIPMPGYLGFYMFITLGLIGFLIPWAIASGRVYRETIVLRNQVFEALQLMAAYARTGVSLPDALLNISETIGPPLGPRIRSYAMLIKVHIMSPLEAFVKVFGDLPREMRTLLGVLYIAVRGGRPSDVIKAAASLAANIRRFEEMRVSRLSGASAVVYVAIVAYVVTSIIMTRLMEIMTGLSSEQAGAGARLFTITIPVEHIYIIYYISSLILAFLGGIMVARIVKGATIVAFKYHLIFFIIIFLCFLLLPPALQSMI